MRGSTYFPKNRTSLAKTNNKIFAEKRDDSYYNSLIWLQKFGRSTVSYILIKRWGAMNSSVEVINMKNFMLENNQYG